MANRPKFRDGKPMKSVDVLTGGGWGYTCVKGTPSHGSTWMPKRFQREARAAANLLDRELGKKTKAELVTFINRRRSAGIPARVGEPKRDLLTRARSAQLSRLYPYQSCKRSDK